jgi:hypothetical protein
MRKENKNSMRGIGRGIIKVLSQHLPGGTEKNLEKPQSG